MLKVHQTDEIREAAAGIARLDDAGELFESPGVVSQSREVKESLARFTSAVGGEIRKIARERHPDLVAAGEHRPRPGGATPADHPVPIVLYFASRGTILIRTHINGGGGLCAYGGYNFDSGTCEYYGIGVCNL